MGENNTAKNTTTESKNSTQYNPVFFLVISILIIFCKYKAELFICYFLLKEFKFLYFIFG